MDVEGEIHSLYSELHGVRHATDRRHRANLRRIHAIEVEVAKLSGQLRVIIALLLANGVINLAGQFH